MSKLDDIYARCDVSNNRTENPLSAPEFKQSIKATFLELIGEDETIDPIGNGLQYNLECFAHNELRAELRKKVEEL